MDYIEGLASSMTSASYEAWAQTPNPAPTKAEPRQFIFFTTDFLSITWNV